MSDDSVDDFLLFHINGDFEDHPNEEEEEAASMDLAEVISRLAMDDVCGVDTVGRDLHSVIQRIGSSFPCQNYCSICNIIDLRQKENMIKHHMGTMAKCRGAGGDALREAGAISALLSILWRLIVSIHERSSNTVILLPNISSESESEDDTELVLDHLCNKHQHLQKKDNPNFDGIVMNTTLDLATASLGSLRDLACGSALNRSAILSWEPPTRCDNAHCIENGVHLICAYVKRYDKLRGEEILSLQQRYMNTTATADPTAYTDRGRRELRLLTNALGVVRNVTHSTADVCQECFNCHLVDSLVWRIMPESDTLKDIQSATMSNISSLPDSSCPWREACFRSAASLINLAEKCPDVAHQLGSNRKLMYLLIETWGGASAIKVDSDSNTASTKASTYRSLPLLHLGLAAILNAAGTGALEGGLDHVMSQVLEKEMIRKKVAQRREEERKLQQEKKKQKSLE